MEQRARGISSPEMQSMRKAIMVSAKSVAQNVGHWALTLHSHVQPSDEIPFHKKYVNGDWLGCLTTT